jgi:signal transduction histidine kinase
MTWRSTNPIFHLGYWLFVLVVLTLAFGSSWGSQIAAFYFISMLLPIVLGTSYFFNYYLVPNYYLTGHYFRFGLYTLYTLIISVYLELVVLMFSFIYLGNFTFRNMNPNASDSIFLALVLYLLVFFGSFLLMSSQVKEKQRKIEALLEEKEKQSAAFLEIMSSRKRTKIKFDDILYIESLADYIQIVSQNETLQSKEKISHLATRLPETFVRIHRSYIVNRNKVKQFSYDEVIIEDQVLTIGRSYRKEAKALLSVQPSG